MYYAYSLKKLEVKLECFLSYTMKEIVKFNSNRASSREMFFKINNSEFFEILQLCFISI
jgi:hypothetical protein